MIRNLKVISFRLAQEELLHLNFYNPLTIICQGNHVALIVFVAPQPRYATGECVTKCTHLTKSVPPRFCQPLGLEMYPHRVK